MTAAAEVLLPAAVLAEHYRGGGHDQVADSCLGRSTGIQVIDTTRQLARQVGHILAGAGCGSAEHVDATVVAAALAAGGGVIATADPDDLRLLSAGLVGIVIEKGLIGTHRRVVRSVSSPGCRPQRAAMSAKVASSVRTGTPVPPFGV